MKTIWVLNNGVQGTVSDLYQLLVVDAGLSSPPTMDAFRSRLSRGERYPAELARPPGSFSGASIAARRRGMLRYQEERKLKAAREAKATATITYDKSSMLACQPFLIRIGKPGGKRYFRPGSLACWPDLQIACDEGLL